MLGSVAEAVGRFFLEFIGDSLAGEICYRMGWVMLKVLTLGRYPPLPPERHNRGLVAGLPIVVVLVGVTILFS
jgi:hypothetical protein